MNHLSGLIFAPNGFSYNPNLPPSRARLGGHAVAAPGSEAGDWGGGASDFPPRQGNDLIRWSKIVSANKKKVCFDKGKKRNGSICAAVSMLIPTALKKNYSPMCC